MALHADTIYEVRESGNNNNGGGFYNRNPGTSVDYSQQDSPQLAPADLATPGAASTTLTSAAGGFTAAMVGNIIQILSGANFTAGFYEITVRTDTNTVTLDRSPTPGGAGSGGVGNVGGALANWWTHFNTFVIPGNKLYVKNGSYALSGATNLTDAGTAALPITVEGYNSSRGDAPTDEDRPLLQCGSNSYAHGNYHFVKHIRFKTAHNNGIQVGQSCLVLNCRADGTNTRGFNALQNFTSFIDCEARCTGGNAFMIAAGKTDIVFWGCLAYSSSVGIYMYGDRLSAIFCVIHDCTFCIRLDGNENVLANNTIYNGTGAGVRVGAASTGNRILNNIASDCDTGIIQITAEKKSNYLDYNNYYNNNAADVTNLTKGPHATAYNPLFVRPAAHPRDFSLQAGSQCIGAGFAIRLLGWSSSSSSSSSSASSSSSTSSSSSSSSSA